MSLIKKLRKRKKTIVAVVSVFTAAAVHYTYPTTFPHVYYTITDPFNSTPTEQRIEEQFGIDYEGDSNEARQKELEKYLQTIYEANPALLEHGHKVVLHSEAVKSSALVKPFLSYGGVAEGMGTITIVNNNLNTLTHELAHLKNREVPDEFEGKLDAIFGDTYKKELKKERRRYLWNDNSDGPRNGFVCPYGATRNSENVATYVEKAYDPSFWSDPRLLESEKYLQTLSLLQEYDFISKKQFEGIKATLEFHQFLKQLTKAFSSENKKQK